MSTTEITREEGCAVQGSNLRPPPCQGNGPIGDCNRPTVTLPAHGPSPVAYATAGAAHTQEPDRYPSDSERADGRDLLSFFNRLLGWSLFVIFTVGLAGMYVDLQNTVESAYRDQQARMAAR